MEDRIGNSPDHLDVTSKLGDSEAIRVVDTTTPAQASHTESSMHDSTTPDHSNDHPRPHIAPSYDVVVVGARAAGAAAAMLLARRGLSVLALDRSAYGSDTLSTHSLARVGVLQLSRWGLLERLREEGTPAADTVVFHYGDGPVVVDVSGGGDVDGLYSPRRTVLDRILVDEAVRSGADVVHGVSVTSLTRGRDGRVDGVRADVAGVQRHIGARWVVGADGLRSRVAREVDAATTHVESAAAAVLYGYWTGLPGNELHNFYDQQGRAVGVIPTNDGHACVWIAGRPDELSITGDPRSTYHEAIAGHPALARHLRGATFVGGLRRFGGVPGFLRHPVGPGWALVGDAGYFKDPLSAHGITDAFTSAEFLADALDEARNGDEAAALARYGDRRDDLAAALMPPVAALAALDLDQAGVREAFGRLNAALRHEWNVVQAGRPEALCV